MAAEDNLDPSEITKFDALQDHWWNPTGALQSLHDINALRVSYVNEKAHLEDSRLLDVGCGGGILSEALARQGAAVTGIDATPSAIQVARQHAQNQGLQIDYQLKTVEVLAARWPAAYDIVTCMELIEHVPRPLDIVKACATLVQPGGQLFFATLNRTLLAYLMAIIGGEYLLRLIPVGTHSWQRFIRPAELIQWGRQADLECVEIQGFSYNPWRHRGRYSRHTAVNYMAHFKRPG